MGAKILNGLTLNIIQMEVKGLQKVQAAQNNYVPGIISSVSEGMQQTLICFCMCLWQFI